MSEYGLIGYPIEHSQSPELFKLAYQGKYGYDLIEGKYFEESYARFKKSYRAINVTAPFKEQAFEKADIVSGPAALIGAANILVKTGDEVSAHNSDFTGVILTVAESLFPGIIDEFYATFGADAHKKVHQFVKASLEKRYGRKPEALIVGLGGAGKAAAVAAAEMGFNTSVMNRTAKKAEEFSKSLPEYRFNILGLEDFRKALSHSDLVIYALPMALESFQDLSAGDFKNGQIILEANYRDPAFCALTLARALDGGAKYIPGNVWLACQAISGYSLMTGEAPDVQALLDGFSI